MNSIQVHVRCRMTYNNLPTLSSFVSLRLFTVSYLIEQLGNSLLGKLTQVLIFVQDFGLLSKYLGHCFH